MADPEIPEKIMLLTTFTWPSPPLMWPTMHWARRKILWVIPPVFIRSPTRMKKGMARRGKPVVLEYMRAGSIMSMSVWPNRMKKTTAVRPMETAMGSPSMIRPMRTAKMAAVIMIDFFFSGYFFRASSTHFINTFTFSSPVYLLIFS